MEFISPAKEAEQMIGMSVEGLTATPEQRRRLDEEFTMRMLGTYITLTGWRWLEMHDLISSITDDGQEQRARIRSLLACQP